MNLIALSGFSGSGKSTVAKKISDNYNYTICHPGAVCRDVSILVFGDAQKSSLSKIDDAMRSIDPNIWIISSLKNISSENIVIDGVRYLSNYEYLRPLGCKFYLVECDRETSFDRVRKRDKKFDELAEGKHIGEHDYLGIPFDGTINNCSDLHSLDDEIKKLFIDDEYIS